MGRKLKILCIDGGGIRGIIPAMFLEAIEKSLGEPISKYFDLICGTSTGGIIALAIAAERPMERIRELYEVDGHEIFPPAYRKNPLLWTVSAINMAFRSGEKYPTNVLEDKLKNEFILNGNDLKMCDSKTALCIPSVNVSSGQVVIFKTPHKVCNPKEETFSNDGNKAIWEVARATSAAPTYFKTAKIDNSFFVDGGLYANNPTLVGLIEARRCGFDLSEMSILSLGTGTSSYQTPFEKAKNLNLFNWGMVKGILSLSLTTQSMAVENQISLLNPKQYTRLQCSFRQKLEMDYMEQVPDFKAAADTLIKEKRDVVLSEFFRTKADGLMYPLKGGSNG